MTTSTEKLAAEIRSLSDMEKLHLVETILTDLDKPDPEIDRIWADEARKRWAAYLGGRTASEDYQTVMGKYRHLLQQQGSIDPVRLAPLRGKLTRGKRITWKNPLRD